MIVTADTSFLVSLYAGDVNSPAARSWMATHATAVILTPPLRFETENALRLACFRRKITPGELHHALSDIASDLAAGILTQREIPAPRLWRECQKISAAQTLVLGARAFDILHVAAARLVKADTFLSFDKRQIALANALGLTVAP